MGSSNGEPVAVVEQDDVLGEIRRDLVPEVPPSGARRVPPSGFAGSLRRSRARSWVRAQARCSSTRSETSPPRRELAGREPPPAAVAAQRPRRGVLRPRRSCQRTGRAAGVDVGVAATVATSDGELLHCPWLSDGEAQRLRRLERRKARQRKGSSQDGRAECHPLDTCCTGPISAICAKPIIRPTHPANRDPRRYARTSPAPSSSPVRASRGTAPATDPRPQLPLAILPLVAASLMTPRSRVWCSGFATMVGCWRRVTFSFWPGDPRRSVRSRWRSVWVVLARRSRGGSWVRWNRRMPR